MATTDMKQPRSRLARYKRNLRAMPDAVAKHGARAAEKSAKEHERRSEAIVRKRTGALVGTIRAYPVRGTFATVWRVVAGQRENEGRSQGFNARFEEFGTVNMAPNPFFFTEYRALRPRHRRRMGRAMREAAKEVFGNGG